MNNAGRTNVPSAERARVAADPAAGAGNALHMAARMNPSPDAPYFMLERPVRHVDGTSRDRLSLAEADTLAQAWSCHYLDRGVRPRDRVAVWVEDSFEDLLHFFSLSQIGAIPVLLNGRLPAEAAARLCRRSGVTGVHADEDRLKRIDALLNVPELRWTQSAGETAVPGPRALPVESRYRHADADPVLICHSSGTTGAPKPVIWTHGQAFAGVRPHLTAFLPEPNSSLLSVLPQSHASAVGYTIAAMLAGVPLLVASDRSGPNTARLIERHSPTGVVGFANTYAEMADMAPDLGPLESVATWISIGDASHQAHIAELVRRGHHMSGGQCVPGSMFADCFGSSELGWGGVFSRKIVAGMQSSDRRLGRPMPYANAVVLRQDGGLAEPFEVGFLGVQGPTVTPGYWGDSDMTYRNQLRGHWLSGDLVFRDDNGRFHHVDRTADMIETPGGPAYSVLMEETLLARVPEIEHCAVVAAQVDGRNGAVAVVRARTTDADELLTQANMALRDSGQQELDRLDLAECSTDIPIGPTGKVLKRQLRKRYAVG